MPLYIFLLKNCKVSNFSLFTFKISGRMYMQFCKYINLLKALHTFMPEWTLIICTVHFYFFIKTVDTTAPHTLT